MPTDLGTIGAFGAAGGIDAMKQLIAERLKRALLARQEADQQRQLAQEDERIGLVRSGQETTNRRLDASEARQRLIDRQMAVGRLVTDTPGQSDITEQIKGGAFDLGTPEEVRATEGLVKVGPPNLWKERGQIGDRRYINPRPAPAPQMRTVQVMEDGKPVVKIVPDVPSTFADQPAMAGNEPLEPVRDPVTGRTVYARRSGAAGMEVPVPRRNVLGQERAALGFYNRAKEADEIAAPLEPTIAGMGLASQAGLNYLPNWLQTDLGQSYRQAQRTFTEARLRKESGAAIPNSEYENDSKTYFAQPGDTPQILEQKRIARQEVLDGIGFASGQAFEEFYGEQIGRAHV